MITTKDGHKCTRSIIKRILISVLLFIATGGVIMVLCLTGERGLFGYQARIVMSSSMSKNQQVDAENYAIQDIPAGSLILIRLVPLGDRARGAFYASLKVGDILTFSYQVIGGNTVITHRIQCIEKRDGGYTITLCGDNGTHVGTQTIDTSDTQSPNRVIGKVVSKSYFLGVLTCILRQPQCFAAFCMVVLAAMLMETLKDKGSLSFEPKSLRAEGTMKNKIFVLAVALVLCCFALVIGVSYGLYDETVSIQTHLVAGSLKATLERVKLTTYNIGSDGNFSSVVDDKVKDFSTATQDSVFGITAGTVAAPGSTFTAEMRITNGGDVAFYYYLETFCNAVVSDQTFASMLQLTVLSEDGVQREVRLGDGLTMGEEGEAVGSVNVGESENFTVTLKFLDDANNNKVENKFVLFDLCIHAVQKIDAA